MARNGGDHRDVGSTLGGEITFVTVMLLVNIAWIVGFVLYTK